MSDQEQLIESHEGGITTLTMNRPGARNAMTGEMIQSLLEALPRLAQDPQVRCIVLTGAGGAFCAGGDVKGFASGAAGGGLPPSQEERIAGLRGGFEVSKLLHEIAKPTLAAMPGAAAGAVRPERVQPKFVALADAHGLPVRGWERLSAWACFRSLVAT